METEHVQVTDRGSLVQQVGLNVQHQASGECADVLRDQIAMLEHLLAPGGEWDRRIAEAEQTIAHLRFERGNALHALNSLHDALEEIMHQERIVSEPCAESEHFGSVTGDRLAHSHTSSTRAA